MFGVDQNTGVVGHKYQFFFMEVDKELEWELRPTDRVLVEGQGAKIKCVAR